MQHPNQIEDKYLKSFVVVFLKVVDLIKDYINQYVLTFGSRGVNDRSPDLFFCANQSVSI